MDYGEEMEGEYGMEDMEGEGDYQENEYEFR